MARLILFDIDETMIASHGAGRRAIEKALSTVFQKTISLEGHSLSGKTDPQICVEALATHGMTYEEAFAKLEEIYKHYLPILEQEVESSKDFLIHAGVIELLDSLQEHPEAYLGLLTGNIERGARVKLKRPGLNKYFEFGAFGCDSHDRMKLPAVAHKRGNDLFKQRFEAHELVIIGDARNDVLCAKGYGAKSIAVCTGKTPRAALVELKPDYLLDDLKQTLQVIDAIFAN